MLMGGQIHVNSDVGFGSEFMFHLHLPVADVTEPAIENSVDLSIAHVLVVDDLRINRLILHDQLRGD